MFTENIAICQGCQMAIEHNDYEWGTTESQLEDWMEDLDYRNPDFICKVEIIGDEVEETKECGICFEYFPEVASTATIHYTKK